jgi:hypothetical protein
MWNLNLRICGSNLLLLSMMWKCHFQEEVNGGQKHRRAFLCQGSEKREQITEDIF